MSTPTLPHNFPYSSSQKPWNLCPFNISMNHKMQVLGACQSWNTLNIETKCFTTYITSKLLFISYFHSCKKQVQCACLLTGNSSNRLETVILSELIHFSNELSSVHQPHRTASSVFSTNIISINCIMYC